MSTLINVARSLFDTDDIGAITNAEDVHPEYQRAVVDLVTEYLLGGDEPEAAREFIRRNIGLPDPVSATETQPVGPQVEYLTYREERSQHNSDNYALNPHNGNFEATLAQYAKEGWHLISFDWNSWRNAVFMRKVQPVIEHGPLTETTAPLSLMVDVVGRVRDWLVINHRQNPDNDLLGIAYEKAPVYRSDLERLVEAVES
jgi:hypothetical protein